MEHQLFHQEQDVLLPEEEEVKTLLITGGAGFIGSHFIEHIIRTTTWKVVCIDKLSYACKGWARLEDSGVFYLPRVKCITWDLAYPFSEGILIEIGHIDIIIHMAAETHVDNSIRDPVGCIKNNVDSTLHILEYARSLIKLGKLQKFLYFSTDEVFGPAPNDISYTENDRHNPTNPYSSSKSASEVICLAYQNTYKLPLIITNLMNVYGERQHVEKFIPLVISKVLNNETVDIHTGPDSKTPGSRFYIHARNVADAIIYILKNSESGQKYNITGECEQNNLEIAQKIASIIGKPLKYNLINYHENRPGHDIRYSLDGSKLYEMGWSPPVSFEKSLEKTIKWTLVHRKWLEP